MRRVNSSGWIQDGASRWRLPTSTVRLPIALGIIWNPSDHELVLARASSCWRVRFCRSASGRLVWIGPGCGPSTSCSARRAIHQEQDVPTKDGRAPMAIAMTIGMAGRALPALWSRVRNYYTLARMAPSQLPTSDVRGINTYDSGEVEGDRQPILLLHGLGRSYLAVRSNSAP